VEAIIDGEAPLAEHLAQRVQRAHRVSPVQRHARGPHGRSGGGYSGRSLRLLYRGEAAAAAEREVGAVLWEVATALAKHEGWSAPPVRPIVLWRDRGVRQLIDSIPSGRTGVRLFALAVSRGGRVAFAFTVSPAATRQSGR
jgi:hypothetical protein